MRKLYAFLISILLLSGLEAVSQCNNASAFASATINPAGTIVTISTCSFAGEYSTINGAVNGQTLRFTSSVGTDEITIRSGSPGGPVLAFGTTPLVFANTFTGTIYAHWNTPGCGSQSSCRTTTVQCTSCVLAPPANDLCTGAININCGQTIAGTTAAATSDAVGTCTTSLGTAPGVWYSFVGTGTNNTLSLCGSSYDTKIGVFSGTCAALVCVAGNDDFCGLQSQVTVPTTAGTTYYVLVTGFSTASGAYTLNRTCAPPANDICTGAVTINCGQTINGSTVGATSDAVATCGTTLNTAPGLWYRFTGDGSAVTMSLCGSSYDTKIGVFSGTCAALVCVAGNDDFCGLQSQVTFNTVAATDYFILVTGFSTSAGNFSLTRTCVPPCVGVPSPGSIAPVTSSVCFGTPVVLTLSGYTNATGLTFQWRESATSGGTYTNIPGATGTTYAFNAAATRYYICTVTCNNPGGGSASTAEVVVNVGNPNHTSLTATPSVMCSPGATTIAATVAGGIGNYTHTLTGPGTIGPAVPSGPNNSNVTFSVTAIPAGVHTYTLTSTDGIGCAKASNIQITVNQTPIITLTTVPPSPVATNYVMTTSAGNSIVPGTALVAGSRGDDVSAPVTLPFNYFVYGNSYSSLMVASNGSLQFSGAGNNTFTNSCPMPSVVNLGAPFFMPNWDDLRTDVNPGDGIFTSVSGVAPNRIFNIEWRGSLFGVGGSTINFEARLYEGIQKVDFIYGTNTNNGASATIGVQGAAAPTSLFTEYSCNAASLSSGLGVSFELPALSICNGSIVRIDASVVPTLPLTVNNNTNTHIPAGGNTSGNASLYPNATPVSGLPVSGVTVKSVTLNNYSHTFPDDVDVVLVSPSGQSVILMSDAGGAAAATGQTFTFDDAAAATLADAVFNPTGTYKPTNFGAGDTWPAPGPGGSPVSTTLSTFSGNPNGNWNLYIVDDAAGNTGIISTWSITFNVPQPVVFSPLTNLFTDAAATIAYTGTPAYTVWARPTASTNYTATSTITGCTGTSSVLIQVRNPPAITAHPVALAAPICPGFNVNYSVTATGNDLTYQWEVSTNGGGSWSPLVNGLQYSGVTTPNLTIINVSTSQNNYRYRCVVSGSCPPAATSNSVTLVVATTPVINTQPANRVVCTPDAAVFTVVTSGVPTPNIFQWQVSTTGAGGPWVNLTTGGSYTNTLTVSPTAVSQSGNLYRVIVTNSCGQTVTSNNASLTVNAPTPVTLTALPTRICLSDTLVPLNATPVGGSWSGMGVSGFNFVPSATAIGAYTLTYTYVNILGCTSTGTVIAKVEDCPERIRQLDEDAVKVYPNPNNGRFNIRVNSVLYNYLGMRVYNTLGQPIRTQTFSGLVYGRVIPVDLGDLPSGTYMVKIFYDDGIRTNEKTFPIMIQR